MDRQAMGHIHLLLAWFLSWWNFVVMAIAAATCRALLLKVCRNGGWLLLMCPGYRLRQTIYLIDTLESHFWHSVDLQLHFVIFQLIIHVWT